MERPSDENVSRLPTRPEPRGESFYAVGGPVQPGRGCYIERAADRQLYTKLVAGEYCHVLAPRQSGKSSLVARTARKLRAEGFLTAVVDLSQMSTKDGSSEAGRWYYTVAYRIVRELRLKVDLQHWWQEKKPLTQLHRLTEFFWEIVLANTRAPIVIFLDEIECVEALEFAHDFFVCVRACHDARATEPDYERLRFVMLGTSTAGLEGGESLFDVGRNVELPDFTFEEARPLCKELGLERGNAERALYRVFYWTGGQPFLTQKLCRAIARNPEIVNSDADVDELVKARFLTPHAIRHEPNLTRVLESLNVESKLTGQALKLYRRVHRGRKLRYDPLAPLHALLRVCGLCRVTDERRLAVRNRIYADVFSTRWVGQTLPFDWRGIATQVSVLALLVGVPYWYSEILPHPYKETLRLATVDFDVAQDAYRRLRRMPGHGGKAQRLFAGVLERRSLQAATLDEVLITDAELRALPGFEGQADELLSLFWERRAVTAEAEELRDEALLYRLHALGVPSPDRRRRAGRLLGGDYPGLATTIRPGGRLQALALDPVGRSVTTVTAGHQVRSWDPVTGLAQAPAFVALAEEFVTLRRRIAVDIEGQAGNLSVTAWLDHPQATDLVLRVTAPSGRTALLPVRSQATGDSPEYTFTAGDYPELAAMRGEAVQGTWTLAVEDQFAGTTGFLVGWALRLAGIEDTPLEDRLPSPVLIPDPRGTDQVNILLSPDGRRVAAISRDPQTRGFLQVWDVGSAAVIARIPVDAGARYMAFDAQGVYLVTAVSAPGGAMRVWRAASGQEVFSIEPEAAFVSEPVLAPEGSFLAVADGETAGDNPGSVTVRVWDLGAGQEIARVAAGAEVIDLSLGPGARRLATLDREHVVRVWRPEVGALLASAPHGREVIRSVFDPSGRWLATVDAASELRVWPVAAEEAPEAVNPVLERAGVDAADLHFDAQGDRLLARTRSRSFEVLAVPEGTPQVARLVHTARWRPGDALLGHGRVGSNVFSRDGALVVTGRGGEVARIWSFPTLQSVEAPVGRFELRIAGRAQARGLSADGTRIIVGAQDGSVVIRDAVTGQIVAGVPEVPSEPPPSDPAAAATSPGLPAAGASDPTPAAPDEPPAPAVHGGPVTAMAFTPEGSRAVTVGADGSVIAWSTVTGQPVGTMFHHGSGLVETMAVAPDRRTLIVGGALGARLWDIETGSDFMTLGPGRRIMAVAFDGFGRRAVTSSEPGVVEMWDVVTREVAWSSETAEPVTSLAVHPDGTHLAAGTRSGRIFIWDLGRTGEPLTEVRAGGDVLDLRYADGGEHLVVQTDDWLHAWRVDGATATPVLSHLLPGEVAPGAWWTDTQTASRVTVLAEVRGGGTRLIDLDAAAPPGAAVEGETGELLDAWETRLKLRLDEAGVAQVVSGDAPVITADAPPPVVEN